MSNTITAYFKGRVGVAESVYQNDYGIVMAFDSIDLPAHFDCYFSRLNQEEALPGLGADNRVTIPNSILANPGNVTIHIPLHTGESDSEVEYVIYFKVIGRARPIDDGTPEQQTAISEAIAVLQYAERKIPEDLQNYYDSHIAPTLTDDVSNWLDEHPEATTTVQDHSLTYEKLVVGTLGYVTPEMFGAKADDSSFDNATAFTNAINSGYPVKSFGGTYYFATELIIQNKTGADLDFTPSTFVYTGTEYLINFIALRASTIRLGVINALSGGAIRFTGENNNSWSQYDNVYFREIRANTDCIYIEQKEGGYWCNEINFHNGRFISGDVGLHIMLSSTTDANSHVNTYNIGVEGVTTGFFFENLSDGSKAIRHGMFVNTRFEESFTYLARSVGVVTSMLFISPYSPNANMLSVSGLSDGWQFVDSTRGNQCTVINGKFYAYGIPQLTYGGRGLAENTDLNDIIECGSYYVSTSATAQTILNKPNINEVFRLNVISLSGGDVRGEWMNKKQIIEYRNHRYSRYITSDGGGSRTYSAWIADISSITPSVSDAPITAGTNIVLRNYTKAVYDDKMVMLHLDFTTSAGIPAWQVLFTVGENIRPQATRNCTMNGISGTAFVATNGTVTNESGIPNGTHVVADLIYFL